MKNAIFLLLALLLFTDHISFCQTNPTPQAIPYSQDFSSLLHTSTTYPAGWQGWQIGTTSSTSFRTNTPTGDLPLIASSTAANNSGGIHNYNGKIGFLASGSVDVALCLAVNMTGLSDGLVVINSNSTIRNPYDGSANTRLNSMTLQFRAGTTGSFAALTEFYTNTTVNQTSAVTTPQNVLARSFLLPASCNNQPVVQLRWVQRDNTGSGGRPSFAIDNITVCAPILTPLVSIIQTSGTNPSCFGSTRQFTASPVNGGSTPEYQWKVNNVTVQSSFSNIYTVDTLNNNDTVSCTMFTSENCVTANAANSNAIRIEIQQQVSPAVTITVDYSDHIICEGNIVTFTAAPFDGGSNPSYQWTKNGTVNVGTNSSIYIDSSSVIGNYALTCEMTSSCIASPGPVTSNSISKAVYEAPEAITGFVASDTSICAGETITLKRIGGNAAAGVFTYYQDGCINFFNGGIGSFLGAGDSIVITPSSTRTYFAGIEGTCPLTNCDSVVVRVTSFVTPSITIASDHTDVIACEGTVITYTSSTVNGGNNYVLQWTKNGIDIPGENDSIYIDSSLTMGSYTIGCKLITGLECINGQDPFYSNGIGKLILENPAAPDGFAASQTSICAGESVTLKRVGGNSGSGVFAYYKDDCINFFNGGIGSFLGAGDSIVVTPVTTTTYYLNIEGLCPLTTCLTQTITVNQPSIAASAIITSSTNTCHFDNITLTVDGGFLGTGASWQWMIDSCNAGIAGLGNSIVLSPSPGIHTFYVKANGMCNSNACTAAEPVTVNPKINWFRDDDSDGYGNNADVISACVQPSGYILNNADCNDNNSAINPGATEICSNGTDENCNGMTDDACSITLNLKLYIEALYTGGTLTSALQGISDSLTVELHNSSAPYDLAFSEKGVLGIDGNASVVFPSSVLTNSFYVVIRHRNSMETWSKDPILFNAAVKSYDFTFY